MITSEILNLEFYSYDLAEDLTVREYFKKLLLTLWEEEEEFSGKRPFGNSGWQYELAAAFIIAKVIDGKLDEDGYVEKVDDTKFNEIVVELINSL